MGWYFTVFEIIAHTGVDRCRQVELKEMKPLGGAHRVTNSGAFTHPGVCSRHTEVIQKN